MAEVSEDEAAATPKDLPITPRHWRFIEEYVIDLNGTQAAIRAGYSPRGAAQHGSKLLGRPAIAAEVARRVAERSAKARVTADRVLEEYARIAFANIARFAEWGPDGVTLRPIEGLSEHDTAAVAEIVPGGARNGNGTGSGKLKLHDKKAALAAIARHLGLFDQPPPATAGTQPRDRLAARSELRRRIARLATGEKE